MSKHTETPWVTRLARNMEDGSEGLYISAGASNEDFGSICNMYTYDKREGNPNIYAFENAEANADFIIKATDSYGELVRVLKDGVRTLRDGNKEGDLRMLILMLNDMAVSFEETLKNLGEEVHGA